MSNLKKYMKVKKIILLTVIMQAVMIFPAYADVLADLKKTKLYTGTIDILNGISMAVLAVSVLITVFLTIVNLVKYQTADQQERPQIKKNIKETIVIGLIIASISGVVKVFFSAYGLKDETGSKVLSMVLMIYLRAI